MPAHEVTSVSAELRDLTRHAERMASNGDIPKHERAQWAALATEGAHYINGQKTNHEKDPAAADTEGLF